MSTGQKKTLDICIIFGILQNVIANVNLNILFLDELFSNMDSEMRDLMLSTFKESLSEGRTIFTVNHGEMRDEAFDHKIRVSLINKKIEKQNIKKIYTRLKI